MHFELKPDAAEAMKRHEAFWHCEIIDRPLITITLPKPDRKPVPQKNYATHEERWLDVEFRAEQADISLGNNDYLFDAMPIYWPNMGPEIFSAWCGCGYEFGERTTWTEPCLFDWADFPTKLLNMQHPLFIKLEQFTKALLQRGKGRFVVGLTDFHAGGDHLAALRDPQTLAFDMIDNVQEIIAALKPATQDYFVAYDHFYNMLRAAGMPITSWINLLHEGKYYIPSNDFSCMVSKKMFDDVFLPGIIEECRFLDRSIYHLDGPGALQHLPSLLEIPELNAIQWVCGSGNEGYHRWVKVYQAIQNAKKGMQLIIDIKELPMVFETLRPEGVYFSHISGIDSRETAQAVVERICKWA